MIFTQTIQNQAPPSGWWNDNPLKVTYAGKTVAAKTTRQKGVMKIRKLSQYQYEVIATGEVKDFNPTQTRGDNKDRVILSLSKLRDIINANSSRRDRMKFITTTYAENMTCEKRLYSDTKEFIRKLRKYCAGYKVEYINVVEPQGRGAWHNHFILIFDRTAPYLDNDTVISPLWGHGFVKTKAIDDIENLGAYFSAYFCDIEFNDENVAEIKELNDGKFDYKIKDIEYNREGEKVDKAFIKGGRICMYPPGMNIFRCSRGIQRPEYKEVEPEDFERLLPRLELTYEKTVVVTREVVLNFITGEKGLRDYFIHYRYFKWKPQKLLKLNELQEVHGLELPFNVEGVAA